MLGIEAAVSQALRTSIRDRRPSLPLPDAPARQTLPRARPTTGSLRCGAGPAGSRSCARWSSASPPRNFNYRDHASGWRVDLDGLEKGQARLVLSVLYEPFAEIDLDELPGSDPEDGYFTDLVDHLDRTEAELARIDPAGSRHVIARARRRPG